MIIGASGRRCPGMSKLHRCPDSGETAKTTSPSTDDPHGVIRR
jgi:hypothetical protein